jgi:hypothetical protein
MTVQSVGEVGFAWGGADFTLRFDMGAIRSFEIATGQSIFDAFDHLQAAQEGRVRPRLSLLGDLVRAGLSAYHPDIDAETAMEMAIDPLVSEALIGSYVESMPRKKVDDSDPPKPAGRKRSGTGTRSSRAGSRRGKA